MNLGNRYLRYPALAWAALALASPPCAPALAASAASQQAPSGRIDDAQLQSLPAFIDGVLAQQLDSREVAGAVISIVHGGKLIFSRGYGFADIDRNIPADPQRSLFRPGSVSKLVTWTALMQMVEQGRVDLDADVNRYLDFRIPGTFSKPILVKHLLDHTAGFEDRDGITAENPSEFQPLNVWLARNIPTRVRQPGVEISYSNYGSALAGYIVQRVSGEPFPTYVERHIFKPLGMEQSTFREPLPAHLEPYRAVGYEVVDGRFIAKPFEYYHNIMPAGSSSSTAEDMARFMIAHLNGGRLGSGQILRPETVRLMHSRISANEPSLPGFAHGFYALRETGPRIIGHGGNTDDFHSMMMLVPETNFGVFVSYSGGDGSYQARTELINAMIGRLFPEKPMPLWTGPVSVPPIGSYRTNRRSYSKPADPTNDIKVAASGERGLVMEAAGRKTYWSQVGPARYQKTTGARSGGPYEHVVFYGSQADPRFSFSSQPMLLYRLVRP